MKNKDFYNLNYLWFIGLKSEDETNVTISIKMDENTIGEFESDICPKCILTHYNKWLEEEYK